MSPERKSPLVRASGATRRTPSIPLSCSTPTGLAELDETITS